MGSPYAWDFSIVKRSGLTQKEFAALAKVSRVTANHWLHGRRTPSRALAGRTAKLLDRITEAVHDGRLPPATPRPARLIEPQVARQRNQEIINALTR